MTRNNLELDVQEKSRIKDNKKFKIVRKGNLIEFELGRLLGINQEYLVVRAFSLKNYEN